MEYEKIKSIGRVFLLSVVFSLFYLKATKVHTSEENFYVSCIDGYVTTKAYNDLYDVKVLYNNKTICSWNYIKKGSLKVCDVFRFINNRTRVFLIKSAEGENVVICYSIRILPTHS